MKKLLAAIVFMSLVIPSFIEAKTKVTVTRNMAWGDFLFYGRLAKDYNAGVFSMLRNRYDLTYEKKKDDKVVNDDAFGFFTNEIFLGPYFVYKKNKFTHFNAPTWRPMMFYSDNVKKDDPKDPTPEGYLHHTFHWFNMFKYRIARPISLMYRLIIWHRFPVSYNQAGAEAKEDANTLTRHFFNVIFHINKQWSYSIGDEIFINHSVDKPGEQSYWRNIIWTGFSYRPVKMHQFDIQYVRCQTYKYDDDTKNITVTDNYFRVAYRLRMNFAGKPAAQKIQDAAIETAETEAENAIKEAEKENDQQ